MAISVHSFVQQFHSTSLMSFLFPTKEQVPLIFRFDSPKKWWHYYHCHSYLLPLFSTWNFPLILWFTYRMKEKIIFKWQIPFLSRTFRFPCLGPQTRRPEQKEFTGQLYYIIQHFKKSSFSQQLNNESKTNWHSSWKLIFI